MVTQEDSDQTSSMAEEEPPPIRSSGDRIITGLFHCTTTVEPIPDGKEGR